MMNGYDERLGPADPFVDSSDEQLVRTFDRIATLLRRLVPIAAMSAIALWVLVALAVADRIGWI